MSEVTAPLSGSDDAPTRAHIPRLDIVLAADGEDGRESYPVNFSHLYNLKGRLFTLIDATFTDPQQREAQKDVVWKEVRSWLEARMADCHCVKTNGP